MSASAALLDRLGRPGDIRLATAVSTGLPRLPTGLWALDEALGGGLPRGRVTELIGPRSAGRTGLACAIAAGATRAGETVAWVDPGDTLEPETASAAGIVLARTLWVRPRSEPEAMRAAEIVLGASGFGLVVLDIPHPAQAGTGTWSRLARAAEQTRSVLLVLAPRATAGTFTTLDLAIVGRRVRWSGEPGGLVLLDGIEARVTVARSRVGRPGGAIVVRQACA